MPWIIGIDEDAVRSVGEVIARCAAYWPVVGEIFARGENLLDDYVRLSSGPIFFCRETLLQTVQVSGRIAQTVDVINSQSGKRVSRNEAQDVAVTGLKNNRVFDAHSDEVCDGEEAAVIAKRQLVMHLAVLDPEETVEQKAEKRRDDEGERETI